MQNRALPWRLHPLNREHRFSDCASQARCLVFRCSSWGQGLLRCGTRWLRCPHLRTPGPLPKNQKSNKKAGAFVGHGFKSCQTTGAPPVRGPVISCSCRWTYLTDLKTCATSTSSGFHPAPYLSFIGFFSACQAFFAWCLFLDNQESPWVLHRFLWTWSRIKKLIIVIKYTMITI